MHRDLKGANLLVNNRGELKITDFGLARPIEENRLKYTPGVVTRWYRPPELLFGSDIYNESIDIWGAGCIIAEMYIRKPLFGASSDLEQLKTICMYCGTPTEETYPGVRELPDFSKIQLKSEKRIIKEYLESKKLDRVAVDLIDKMLVMDPKKRITAQQALEHEYFKCEPLPCLPSEIGQFESSHVYTVQQQKEKEYQQQIENEPKRSRFEYEKEMRRSNQYNDHDSRHSESNYNRNDHLRYGDHCAPPPPPPPPPPSSTLRNRHANTRENTNIGREADNYHSNPRHHEDYDNSRNQDDDHRHHGDHRNHYDDYRQHSGNFSRNYHYRQEERNVVNPESRMGSHRSNNNAIHEKIGNIDGSRERIVFNGSASLSRSRSRSPERKKIADAPGSGAERSRRSAISYDDL